MSILQPRNCLSAADALARGAWEEARAALQTELAREESPEALEGIGLTGWWLDLAESVFESRERAYRLYLERGDKPSAARVAVWLAWDYWAFRGIRIGLEKAARALKPAVADRALAAERPVVPGQPHRDARRRRLIAALQIQAVGALARVEHRLGEIEPPSGQSEACLLYTSDAADE